MSQDCSLLHLGQNSYSLPFSMILLADFPLPSGNLTQPWNYIMVNSHSYVSLLEGSSLVSVRSLGRTNDSLRDSHFAGYWTRPCSSKQFVFCFFLNLAQLCSVLIFFLGSHLVYHGLKRTCFWFKSLFFCSSIQSQFWLVKPHCLLNKSAYCLECLETSPSSLVKSANLML
jgi:hypothetical protein